MARETGLEPATSAVTGRRSNQLSYSRIPSSRAEGHGSHRVKYVFGAGSSSGWLGALSLPLSVANDRAAPAREEVGVGGFGVSHGLLDRLGEILLDQFALDDSP